MKGILYQSGDFAIIDEAAYINDVYKTSGYQVDANLFNINGPYMMDSQFEAMKNPNRRIRKRKRPANEYLSEDCNFILGLLPKIKDIGISNGWFVKCEFKDNNKIAREAAKLINSRDSISVFDKTLLCNEDGLFVNNSDEFIIIGQNDDKIIIPPRAKFHVGNVDFISNYKLTGLFDLIIMDPPWFNRSARRTANYELSNDIIYKINMNNLNENGLACLWVTNRKGIQEECDVIFKQWNLEKLATWYWLKVTKEGEPVCDFNSSHKVPFEIIFIGCPNGKVTKWKNILPNKFLFASVPMSIHSRKPPMQLLLSTFQLNFSEVLELFARNLWPNSVSVGFEPLFLQNILAFRTNKVV